MKSFISLLTLGAALCAAVPQPLPLEVTEILEKRQTNSLGVCSFNNATAAIAGKKACKTIILNGINVPANTTLDMTSLTAGTTVGSTTFECTITKSHPGHLRRQHNLWICRLGWPHDLVLRTKHHHPRCRRTRH